MTHTALRPEHLNIESLGLEDVAVAGLNDGEGGAAVEATAGRPQLDVVAIVEDDTDLGQVRVVLNLRLADGRTVVGEDDKLAGSGAQRLQRGLEAEHGLSAAEDEPELAVEVLSCGLLHHKY